jgi:hypothetical protein
MLIYQRVIYFIQIKSSFLSISFSPSVSKKNDDMRWPFHAGEFQSAPAPTGGPQGPNYPQAQRWTRNSKPTSIRRSHHCVGWTKGKLDGDGFDPPSDLDDLQAFVSDLHLGFWYKRRNPINMFPPKYRGENWMSFVETTYLDRWMYR